MFDENIGTMKLMELLQMPQPRFYKLQYDGIIAKPTTGFDSRGMRTRRKSYSPGEVKAIIARLKEVGELAPNWKGAK